MTLPIFCWGCFFVLMERRRLEDSVLENVSFQTDTRRFFERLTPRELAAVLLAADGMGQVEIAAALGVARQTVQKRIGSARSKATQVFGEEALVDRSNPRDIYRKNGI